MRVLVTGGSGFLGSHICDELARRGHEVRVLDLTPSEWLSGQQNMVIGDILKPEELASAIAGCEAVYHCAAIADLDRALETPAVAIDVNIQGTLRVMQAASEAGARRFMHASSVYVFSRGGSIYRTTKQAAENLVQDLSPQLGMQSTILRFGSLYGPRADSQNAILRLVQQAVSEKRIDFWGDGTEIREYIHISDAAALAVDALASEFVGQALHITGRERLSTLELLQTIDEMLGGQLTLSLHDEPFEGRYRLTPYSYQGGAGRRIVGQTYLDLGLGLMDMIREASEATERETRA